MRKLLIFFSLIFFSSLPMLGQSALTIELGRNFTNFKFFDDKGDQDTDYKANFNNSLTLGYAYYTNSGVFFSSKVGFRKAGATYNYDDFDYHWNLNYSEFRLGVGYEHKFGSFLARFSSQGYIGYLFRAEQRLHNVERNMLTAGTIEEIDYGVFFTPGVGYEINDKLSVGLDFNYMLGLANIEKDDEQENYNTLMGGNLSLTIKL